MQGCESLSTVYYSTLRHEHSPVFAGRGQVLSVLQMTFLVKMSASEEGLLGGFGCGCGGLRYGGAGLPHFPEDFEPALAEAAQGAGVTLAFSVKRQPKIDSWMPHSPNPTQFADYRDERER